MYETAIVAIAGILGTLLASAIPRILEYHYSEKRDELAKRKSAISQVKLLAEEISKMSYGFSLFYKDMIKLFKTNSNNVNLDSFQNVYKFYIDKGIELRDELLKIAFDVVTYEKTKDLFDEIYTSGKKTTDFFSFVSKKFTGNKFTDADLKEIETKQKELENPLTNLRMLKFKINMK